MRLINWILKTMVGIIFITGSNSDTTWIMLLLYVLGYALMDLWHYSKSKERS